MATELTFRLAFVACWLIFFVAVIPLRLKARAPAAAAPRRPMNRGRLAALIAFAPLWFAGVLLYPFYPSAIAPLSMPLPERRLRHEAMMAKLKRHGIGDWFSGFVRVLDDCRNDWAAPPLAEPAAVWQRRSAPSFARCH